MPITDAATPTFALHGYAATMGGSTSTWATKSPTATWSAKNRSTSWTGRRGRVHRRNRAGHQNFHAICAAHTTGALQMIHGTSAGNIVQIDAPVVQLLSPSYADSNGILMLNMQLALIPDAGDDELTLTVR